LARRADELSDTLKATMLFATVHSEQAPRGNYYAKAQNLARKLKAAYDAVLDRYDLLHDADAAHAATKIPAPDAPRMEINRAGLRDAAQHGTFDVTGIPR